MVLGRSILAAVGLLALLAPAANGHGSDAHGGTLRAGEIAEPCPGAAIEPEQVVTGEFGKELMGSYVLLPFDVPAGTTAVRVKYCFDKPDTPLSTQVKHTLDLGLYEPRVDGEGPWGPAEFRGWGGSSHPDVTVSREGFSSEQEYLDDPKGHVNGRTTRGFRPGPIDAGRWAVELGVAAVAGQSEGDSDGKVAWRVEIDLAEDPRGKPYVPVPYPKRPVRRSPGWYAGDLHVHGEHSALGDATMTELLDFAFRPRDEGGAGLDFITLSDYVSGSSWGEIGRYQPDYPGKLIVRSAEVITYRGHLNSHGNAVNMDYRGGTLYERADDGTLRQVRKPLPPRATFDRIHAAGGFTQINHPTIFPSNVPAFQGLCRGCPWDYSDAETAYGKVDAWEVHTGPAGANTPGLFRPGPNPFTLTAIDRWDALRRAGHRVTAVAVSDSHNAGRTPSPATQSPIGQGTTVVFADELSEKAVGRAVALGHAFVKLWAADDPDLRFDAVTEDGVTAMMGDPLRATTATFTARVLGGLKDGQRRDLIVLRDGRAIHTVPVTSDDFAFEFEGNGAGDYRLQLQRGSAIDALTNPITLGATPMRITHVRPRKKRVGRRTRFVFGLRLKVQDRRIALGGATVRLAGRRATTNSAGRAVITTRVRRSRRFRVRVSKPGLEPRTVRIRAAR